MNRLRPLSSGPPDASGSGVAGTVGIGLVMLGGIVTALGLFSSSKLALLPLMAGLIMLLLRQLRAQPLEIGFLFLFVLSLRVYLVGNDRYLPQEISLSDYLLVLIAFVATAGRALAFWQRFQALFAFLLPLAGMISWLHQSSIDAQIPFHAGILTAQQTSFLYGFSLGIGLAYGLMALIEKPRRRPLALAPWLLTVVFSVTLILATGVGTGMLLSLVAITAVFSVLAARSKGPDQKTAPPAPLMAGAGMGPIFARTSRWLLATTAITTLLLFGFGPYDQWPRSVEQRLSLLRCFFAATFSTFERFVYGLGFTNSSTWLCEQVAATPAPIHANNLFAQIAADNGFFALIGCIILCSLLAAKAWRLTILHPHPTVIAALSMAAYSFLYVQIDASWAQSTFLQVILGCVIGSLILRTDTCTHLLPLPARIRHQSSPPAIGSSEMKSSYKPARPDHGLPFFSLEP